MYNLVDWTDRDVEHPRRFAMTENGDGTYTLTPQPGEIRREGTAYDAEHMNNLETGVDASVLLASFLFSLFSTGAENVVVSVEAKTLPPGSEATASLTTDAGGGRKLTLGVPQGIQGVQGIQGIQGVQGIPGIKGDKGDKGDNGDKGDKGDRGDKGDPGPVGATFKLSNGILYITTT